MSEPPRPGLTLEGLRAAAAQALDRPPGDVTDDTDLIESGLDSLRLMRLAGLLRRHGIDLPLPELAETPTIAAWWELAHRA